MKVKNALSGLTILLASFLLIVTVNAAGLLATQQGGILPNAPDYDWWYGCSPTSAGMMVGYYDINGYEGLRYDNLVPGGTAELSSFGTSGLANNVIASTGHINDYYTDGYLGSDDDLASARAHDSLADFMGTSQDASDNTNGSTSFFFDSIGNPLYGDDLYISANFNRSGMYGIWEYFAYAGYPVDPHNFFNQVIEGYTYTDSNSNLITVNNGFGFDDYKAEIDAGRVVMIHVEGHSMFGYGYNEALSEIILHDTWTEGEKTMEWGTSYSGMTLFGVTCFTPGGGDPVPIPSSIFLLGFGLLGFSTNARRQKKS